MYDYTVEIQNTLIEAEKSIGNIRHIPHGNLNISASVTFGQTCLSEVIGKFIMRYPQIKIKLSLSDELIDLIGGGFDLAVRIGKKLDDSRLHARKIGTTKMELLVHENYLAHHGVPMHPNDLDGHNCLTYKFMGDDRNRWLFRQNGEDFSVKVSGNFDSDNGVPLVQLAAQGLGITYVPDFMVNDTPNKKLVRLLSDYTHIERGIYVVYPDSKQQSINSRVFIDFLAAELKGINS